MTTPNMDGEMTASVGIALQVILAEQEKNAWVAQGIEIDYAAEGETAAEAKMHFEQGLCATVLAHMIQQKPLGGFMAGAPPHDWTHLLKTGHVYLYQTTVVNTLPELAMKVCKKDSIPFELIKYFSVSPVATLEATQA